MPRTSFHAAVLLSLATVLSAGCRKPEIRSYIAPKDPPPAEEHYPGDGHDHGPPEVRPRPKVTWTLPGGWQETASNEVSVATFTVKTDAGEGAVTITPLPNLQGQEALVVNMYRQQAGLQPIEQSAVGDLLKPVEVAGGQGQLLEIDGNSGGKPVRILTAIAHRDGQSWFYRIAGDAALVDAQRPTFLDFLKTVQIEQSADAAAAPAVTASAEPAKSNWTVPEGWTQLAAGQMQVAKFSVPERDGAKAEVSVSTFPSDTGGMLANVNRWRQQLGLGEVDEAGLAESVAPLDGNSPDAKLVSLANENRALLGAIVPREGQWWFYKMMGDTPAVSAARDSFVEFAKAQP